MSVNVQIIIPTHGGRSSLHACLDAVHKQSVPEDWDVRTVVIENGSANAKGVVSEYPAQYLHLEIGNASNARNVGAQVWPTANVLVFLDDDAVPEDGWLAAIVAPVSDNISTATVGAVRLNISSQASALVRGYFVDTNVSLDPSAPFLVGMNMAISARAFHELGGFEPMLGPGGLGGGEDVFLGLQLVGRGGTILFVSEAAVVHQVPNDRLSRRQLAGRAKAAGRSDGWIMHHWHHSRPKQLTARIAVFWLASHFRQARGDYAAVEQYWRYRQMSLERRSSAG